MSTADRTFVRLVNGTPVRLHEATVSAIWTLIEVGRERQRVESLKSSTRAELRRVLLDETEAVSGMVDQIALAIAEHSHVNRRRWAVRRETGLALDALTEVRDRLGRSIGMLEAQRDALDHAETVDPEPDTER